MDDDGQRNMFSFNHVGVCLYIYIYIYIFKPGMLQKLICHFSIKMLKIFCLRDTPSAWAHGHGSLDHNENSQIVVNQRIAAWPTLRSFAITIRPCPWSLWELGNNTDKGSILVPEKMGSAFKVIKNFGTHLSRWLSALSWSRVWGRRRLTLKIKHVISVIFYLLCE